MGEFGKMFWPATGNAAAIETNKKIRLPETKLLPIFITYKSCIPNLPYGVIIGLKALRDVERQLALQSTEASTMNNALRLVDARNSG